MALLNEEKKYIKVNTDGSYDIYLTLEDRERVKAATPFETIKNKYLQIITALEKDAERQYYDSDNWDMEYSNWCSEYNRYLQDYELKKGGKEYPLMKEYFADVSNSIPNIIQSGSIVISKQTNEEIYKIAKNRKYWGDVEDI